MNEILDILAWTAITVTWVHGEIFAPVKEKITDIIPDVYFCKNKSVLRDKASELFFCAQCSGFWIGLLGAIIFPDNRLLYLICDHSDAVACILQGFIVSMLSAIVSKYLE